MTYANLYGRIACGATITTLNIQERRVFTTRIQSDPAFFCSRVLGASLWATQRQILAAVRDTPEIYVPSCHASGKSFTAADVALWFLYAHPNAIVATTVPTARQVKRILWQEIRRTWVGARVPLRLLLRRAH